MGGGTAVTATSRSANYDNTTTMQNHFAVGRIVNGGAVAYELRGVYTMNEELERKAFESWIKDRQQRTVSEFYEAFQLDQLKDGRTMRVAVKGRLVIMMYRTEEKA